MAECAAMYRFQPDDQMMRKKECFHHLDHTTHGQYSTNIAERSREHILQALSGQNSSASSRRRLFTIQDIRGVSLYIQFKFSSPTDYIHHGIGKIVHLPRFV
uniref:(northern house mosquito) hypothetical protein n=1 Tax=Culex pipiens TaxID=7175 RepID=A0A8D8FR07_CULPI